MQRTVWLFALGLFSLLPVSGASSAAQAGDPATLIREKLVSEIRVTKPTADHTDIVTPGDIVLLHKDGLMMCSVSSSYAFSNTYNNGVLEANYKNRAKDAAKSLFKGHLPFGGGGSVADAANNGCPSRKFVAGEKFWITGIQLEKESILISTLSDPYPDASGNQVRYYGEIKVPFPKGSVPTPDQFSQTVAELITVQPQDNNDNGGQGDNQSSQQAPQEEGPPPAQTAAAPAGPAAPMTAIPPPPPPADAAPPTISIGQTKDQVTAAFGQPLREAKLGAKQIFYYKDMKVTFTNGKVSNVE